MTPKFDLVRTSKNVVMLILVYILSLNMFFSCIHYFRFSFHCFRVIQAEEGKKLADSWGAAFMESSAKENEVIMDM